MIISNFTCECGGKFFSYANKKNQGKYMCKKCKYVLTEVELRNMLSKADDDMEAFTSLLRKDRQSKQKQKRKQENQAVIVGSCESSKIRFLKPTIEEFIQFFKTGNEKERAIAKKLQIEVEKGNIKKDEIITEGLYSSIQDV